MCQRRAVAYIECTRTLAILHYKEFNVHKDGALLITLAISVINDLLGFFASRALTLGRAYRLDL